MFTPLKWYPDFSDSVAASHCKCPLIILFVDRWTIVEIQIIGPKSTTIPQAGLDTTTRAGPLAQLIAKVIQDGGDPDVLLLYNAAQWTNATHHPFSSDDDWLGKPVSLTINGKQDAFSQR